MREGGNKKDYLTKIKTMNSFNNSLKPNQLTLLDKIKRLLEKPYKLVLVQRHELERLRLSKNRAKHEAYIDQLYEHYIINKLPKTYLVDK